MPLALHRREGRRQRRRQRQPAHGLVMIAYAVFAWMLPSRHHTKWQTYAWKPRLTPRRSQFDTLEDDVDDICQVDPFSYVPDLSCADDSLEEQSILQDVWRQSKAALLYKPPVGVVAIAMVLRLVLTGRIFRLYQHTAVSAECVLQAEERKKRTRRVRRSFHLDPDDQLYDAFGGVLRIRRNLCWAALKGLMDDYESDEKTTALAQVALKAIEVVHLPGSPRSAFVEEIAQPLSELEHQLFLTTASSSSSAAASVRILLDTSANAAEIRALDALLRLTRDRLLVTCSRLRRTLHHWKRRVKLRQTLAPTLRWFYQKRYRVHSEGDRVRLALTKAAYEAEVARLGSIQKVLMDRPSDLSDQDLLETLTLSAEDEAEFASGKPSKWIPFSLPAFSKYSLRWNAEGGGGFSIRAYDTDNAINSTGARRVLLQRDDMEPQDWVGEARSWTRAARRVICDVVQESLATSVSDRTVQADELEKVQGWCDRDLTTANAEKKDWAAVLSMVDGLDRHRRIGEGRKIGILGGINIWTSQLDVFGIPSALAMIGVADALHRYLLPYWPKFRDVAEELLSIAWIIFEKRFWNPFYGIVKGLISKTTSSLLDAFDVDNEEQSLDYMLRDLGLGDGTASTRKSALQAAARNYEKEMDSGVLKSAIRGRLVRLLLVQVQQLKAGLLHALQSIDVLVDANKLNLQILTAIPSVLIVVFGTRFFVRFLVSVRSRDLRPLEDVHAEMADYLDDMEKSLLLAHPRYNEGTASDHRQTSHSPLPPSELGEFILHINSYLVLLEYCSPPFPSRSCDAIHSSLQELLALRRDDLDNSQQQVALLHLVKQKHMDLLKYI